MKYIIILFLIITTAFAETKKQNITIGIGSYIQSQPYKNVDNIVVPSPVIFFDNDLFYARWSRVGVYFLGDKKEDYSWGVSLTLEPRVYGYNSSDIIGMNEREKTWEGGIAVSAKKNDIYIEIMALSDILDKHNSYIIKTEIGYDFKLGNISFYPSIIAIYQASKFMNYYYGVEKQEALINRDEYHPNSGIQLGVQTYIKYPLTKKLSTLINLRADRLSHEATSSPIVDSKYIYSGLASLIYTFEY